MGRRRSKPTTAMPGYLELLQAWEGPVYGFVRRRLEDEHAAADVTQEVLLAILRDRSSLTDPARERAWVYGVARHALANHLRARRRRDARLARVAVPDPAPPSADLVEERDLEAAVLMRLSELPEDDRAVLELTYFEGLNQVEVASVLGLTRKTVRARLRRGLDRLRARLVGSGAALAAPDISALLCARPSPLPPPALSASLRSQVSSLAQASGSKLSPWILGGLTVKAKASLVLVVLAAALALWRVLETEDGRRASPEPAIARSDEARDRGSLAASPQGPEDREDKRGAAPRASSDRPSEKRGASEPRPADRGPADLGAPAIDPRAEADPRRAPLGSPPRGAEGAAPTEEAPVTADQLSGQIVDASGEPIPDCALTLVRYESGDEVFREAFRSPNPFEAINKTIRGPRTRTDKGGRFAFPVEQARRFVDLEIEGSDFDEDRLQRLPSPMSGPTDLGVIALRGVGRVAVEVLDHRRRPAPGARVALLGLRRDERGELYYQDRRGPMTIRTVPAETTQLGLFSTVAVADSVGRAVFEKVVPGAYVALATSPSSRISPPTEISVTAGLLCQGVVILAPGHRWTLTLEDPQGRAVSGAEVRLASSLERAGDRDLSRDPAPPISVTQRSDPRGQVLFSDLGRDRFSVSVRAPGFAPELFILTIDLKAEQSERTLVLARPSRVTGRVVGPDQRPIAGASIEAYAHDPKVPIRSLEDEPGRPIASARSGDDGAFRLEQLSPGRYRLRFAAAGRPVRWRDLSAGGATELGAITLHDNTSLNLSVLERGGKPASGLFVLDARFDTIGAASYRELMTPGAVLKTDVRGQVQSETMAPGRTRLVLVNDLREIRAVFALELRPNSANELALSLPGLLRFSGSIGGAQGRASLRLKSRGYSELTYEAPIDAASGRFRFAEVLPGSYELIAAFGDDTRSLGVVELDADLERDFELR